MNKKSVLVEMKYNNDEYDNLIQRFESESLAYEYASRHNKTIVDIQRLTDDELDELITDNFSWGEIKQLHKIGDYQIIEYTNDENKTYYKPYINNNDISMSFISLDDAIIGVLTNKYLEPNAARYAYTFINKMLER